MLHVFSAAFPCARCDEIAATVSLVPPGMAIPGARPPADVPPEALSFGAASWRLSIDGGPHPMTVLPIRDPASIAAILDRGDLDTLAAVNAEYANFRCPECRVAYCEDHWTDVVEAFDQGFYDATYARCPDGHRIMIDD